MPILKYIWPDTMKSDLKGVRQRHYATQTDGSDFDLADRLRLFELSDENDVHVPKMISDYRVSIYSAEMNLRLL